jgi:hypothetical protein
VKLLTVTAVWLTAELVWLTVTAVWLTATAELLTVTAVWLTAELVWSTVTAVWLTVGTELPTAGLNWFPVMAKLLIDTVDWPMVGTELLRGKVKLLMTELDVIRPGVPRVRGYEIELRKNLTGKKIFEKRWFLKQKELTWHAFCGGGGGQNKFFQVNRRGVRLDSVDR